MQNKSEDLEAFSLDFDFKSSEFSGRSLCLSHFWPGFAQVPITLIVFFLFFLLQCFVVPFYYISNGLFDVQFFIHRHSLHRMLLLSSF
jgi:hypothetical protein